MFIRYLAFKCLNIVTSSDRSTYKKETWLVYVWLLQFAMYYLSHPKRFPISESLFQETLKCSLFLLLRQGKISIFSMNRLSSSWVQLNGESHNTVHVLPLTQMERRYPFLRNVITFTAKIINKRTFTRIVCAVNLYTCLCPFLF